ncbi:TonB-dependent siderophore receptor [Chlorogloeopsis sp. ULAP02]|uniref:TonB-dependent siderophore receptor n=1 Tax=Chlorogloeopsis sp. ULAP02 TaxID=3107926 RepID=UPI0031367B70
MLRLFWFLGYKCGIIALFLLLAYPAKASEFRQVREKREIPRISEIERIFKSADFLVQSPAPTNPPSQEGNQVGVVPVTGVKANPTDKGVEVILQTSVGEKLQITNRSQGNNFIADIPGAQLRLPSGDAFTFRSQKPITGITEITVTNLDANTIRVTVTGEEGLPVVELFDSDEGLIFGLTPTGTAVQTQPEEPVSETPQEEPSAQQDEPIELVVTGEQDGYRVPNTNTATRTDTPLRDIPQSIQVIPQQVLRDQRADVNSALLNSPSVRDAAPSNFDALRIQVRGFFSAPALDGIVSRVGGGVGANIGNDLTGIERIDVLLGPTSILFGSSSPGGTVNFVTKQPLRDPYYFVEATVGSFDFYRGEVDFSGPLDDDKKVLYRLNASYRDQGFFTEFSRTRNLVIAPVISFTLGENTNLSIDGTYKNLSLDNGNLGLPAVGTILPNPNGQIPRDRITNEGNLNTIQGRIGYKLEHKFSENWSVSNTFRYDSVDYTFNLTFPEGLTPDSRSQRRRNFNSSDLYDQYSMLTNVVGKFSTGSIQHQLLVGFDLGRYDSAFISTTRAAEPIDLFNPVYGLPIGAITSRTDISGTLYELGILVQDQITFADNLKLLVGGRFDTFTQTDRDFLAGTETSQSGNAFSPRVGIVYQPIPPVSLYANYTKSFQPAIGRAFDGSVFQPTRGTQYEVGVKTDINDRLSTTLALYDITQSNVLTSDPANLGFSVQTGEINSQGIELSLTGEILPGWNIFASYAYNDTRISNDNNPNLVGNRVQRTSPNNASLWTTYEFQQGNLQGLGLGLGLFYVGDRAGDNANSFTVPGYLTTDAAIFYKREQFRAAINIKNLFNVDYFEGVFSRDRVFYGAPFTIQGTISWEF